LSANENTRGRGGAIELNHLDAGQGQARTAGDSMPPYLRFQLAF